MRNKKKPLIALVTDIYNWAWGIKSEYIKKYLSNEFEFDIISLIDKKIITDSPERFRGSKVDFTIYDLCLTYGYAYIDRLRGITKRKKITGLTAHRPRKLVEPQMRKAYAVHANSILLFNNLKKMHNRVFYVPNGVDTELFKPLKPIPEKRKNLIVGNASKLSPRKGQEEILIPACRKAGVQFSHFARKYFNAVPHNEMVKVYQDYDIYVVMSKEDGTPNGALEAAACGRLIISNRIGNMPEFIKDGYNGFLVEKNIDAYVEKLVWCKNNRDKVIEMGKNARKEIERAWTWEIQAENYRKMFRALL